jgi:hypothetical protein
LGIVGWVEWNYNLIGTLFSLMVSWPYSGMESIANSYSWVVNCSSIIDLLGLNLFTYEFLYQYLCNMLHFYYATSFSFLLCFICIMPPPSMNSIMKWMNHVYGMVVWMRLMIIPYGRCWECVIFFAWLSYTPCSLW